MRFKIALLLMPILLCAHVATAQAQPAAPASAPAPAPPPVGPVQVVNYLEVEPGFTAKAIALLRTYRDATGKVSGAGHVLLFQEIGTPHRFTVEETWNDVAALEAHRKGDAAKALDDGLAPGRLAPADIRVHQAWGTFKASLGTPDRGVYVKTHIDVSPPQLAALETMLKPFIDTSRNEAGAMRVELLQQIAPRRNHTTLVETWASAAAFNAHSKAAHSRDFRNKLGPILGALYDQRVYKLVK